MFVVGMWWTPVCMCPVQRLLYLEMYGMCVVLVPIFLFVVSLSRLLRLIVVVVVVLNDRHLFVCHPIVYACLALLLHVVVDCFAAVVVVVQVVVVIGQLFVAVR